MINEIPTLKRDKARRLRAFGFRTTAIAAELGLPVHHVKAVLRFPDDAARKAVEREYRLRNWMKNKRAVLNARKLPMPEEFRKLRNELRRKRTETVSAY